jgi:4-amino-4-deoxy-L-arabinose transferase-like glycosyltransferase
LLAALLAALLWRLPSFFDPPWVNDEGTYFAVAQAMAHGYRLYATVWENKPPLIYLVYEAVYHSLGPSLLAVRVLATIAVCATVLLVIGLSVRYAGIAAAPAAGMLAGLILGVPFLEGTTANAEVFLIAFTSLGVWLALRGRSFFAGLAMGVAILFKAVAGFDAAALLLYLVFCAGPHPNSPRRIPHLRGDSLGYAAGVLVLPSVACLATFETGTLQAMIRDAALYPLGYVGHANGGGAPWLALLKLVLLAVLTVWLMSKPFPALWLAWAATGALISGRFFGHYALQAVPPLCVLFAMWLARRPERQARRVTLLLPSAFLLLALTVATVGWGMAASGNDSILARRLQWYANFVRLAVGSESYAVYRTQVDDRVTRNIQIAHRIRSLPTGRLLVWGNSPWVYVLSGRLPATPYTSSLRQPAVPGETGTLRVAIERRRPRVVVVMEPPLPPLGAAAGSLRTSYREVTRIGAARAFVARARQGRSPGRSGAPGKSS